MRKNFLSIILLMSFTLAHGEQASKKFSYKLSGFVNTRIAYQFSGIVNDLDMITYDIPVPGDYATASELNFDVSISEVAFETTYQSKSLGEINSYVSANFRGDNYTLSLRRAYINFKYLLIGQDYTNFCDLGAAPITVDFQGPNSYNANFNIMLRYKVSLNEKWSLATSLEMPQISMEQTTNLLEVPQTLPDLTLWGEFTWGESHIRAAGVLRTLRYYNLNQDKYKSEMGYGVQVSGKIDFTKKFMSYFQMVYGQGITPYIQDLTDTSLDLVVDPLNSEKLQTLPMLGFFLSFQHDITTDMFCSLGYGMVRLYSKNDYKYYIPETYKFAQYFFANIFYNLTPSCQIALEYLMGARENMNYEKNTANRLQTMIQYNF
ncbi:MAG: DcaP family trimeric outer membrane transporter [Rikenellaceae bacterium]